MSKKDTKKEMSSSLWRNTHESNRMRKIRFTRCRPTPRGGEADRVEAIGCSVKQFKPGDEVFGFLPSAGKSTATPMRPRSIGVSRPPMHASNSRSATPSSVRLEMLKNRYISKHD